MNDRELIQQALEALDWAADCIEPRKPINCDCPVCVASNALLQRLAQPEQEPVAWHEPGVCGNVTVYEKWAKENGWFPLYAAPQREWVGLSEEEIAVICGECAASAHRADDISYARAIEAKLKEKNA
jgi:hypothetical protein